MRAAPTRSPLRRWLKRIFGGLGLVVVAAVLVGTFYEQLSRRRAARELPPPGRLVDIGGRRIHLDCRGEGYPTVVFEAGLDINGSLAWSAVHDSIAATTRACAYDRAGVMWSDPKDGLHHARGVAHDLGAALAAGGEAGPFVMVGHSLGGPYIMTFTRHHGDRVAGLVFVDASHPDQVRRLEEAVGVRMTPSMTPVKIAAGLAWTGLVRIALPRSANPGAPPAAARAMAAYAPTSLAGMLAEADAIDSTFADAGRFRTLGDRPVIVLTALKPLGKDVLATLDLTEEQGRKFQETWRALHADEATWSTRSRQVLVPDASHYIQFDRPDLVIAAVREVIDSVRATPGRSPAATP